MEKHTKRNAWSHLVQMVLPHRKQFIVIVCIGLLSTGANLVEPLIYREAINDVSGLFVRQAKEDVRAEAGSTNQTTPPDHIAQGHPKPARKVKEPHHAGHVAERSPQQALETLLWAVSLIFMVNVAGYILTLVGENLNVKLSCLVEQRFIENTFMHVLRLPLTFFSKRSSAAVAKQINQSEEVSAIVTGFSQEILPELISLVGILVIMFWQNVTLTLLAIAVIPVYLWIAWRSANRLETGLSTYYERWEDVSARMQDALTGIKTVKLSGAEQREADNLKKVSGEAYTEYINRTRLSNRYVFWQNTLMQISSALVLGYGGYLTLEHKLTPGDVVMFVSYLDRLYYPIDSLTSLWVNLQQNIASISRAFKLLDNGVEEKSGTDAAIGKGRIEFNDVHFQYTPEREILKGITFALEPGKITALVGSSGAGKTTTVDLLMKLYEPSAGSIAIDGMDLSAQSPSSIRKQIGMVAADGAIFRGTLADNIRYKRPEASGSEVMAAAVAAGMENTLRRLPEGLQTRVGEGGIGLSVGERQRIQIARVLVARPRILILDEATANLDYATEGEIQKTVEDLRTESTVIVIAHRYSMVRNADHVIVLSAGEVMEEGTPAELLAKGGWFASFASAAEGTEEDNTQEEADEETDDVAYAEEADDEDADEEEAEDTDGTEADETQS
ncbi:ABC transporter ATP-binding protein [Chryseolinea lacunae]|uniref:ABC transporter ATP-binding protein n=1 Tax=Chryseolinea lacunae TaxID=2801331 RepID=A0ABS1KTB3_9BACT|nr:ABC transporter ATP-binding protein [Chryseolinea lacunae]MBL0742713.1 ABC transporter ATP-binding protein [Chryseolinea lacunae]